MKQKFSKISHSNKSQSLSSRGTNCIPCAPLVVNSPLSASPLKVFQSVDTINVSLWLDWFVSDFFRDLDSKRSLAQELDIDFVVVDFDGQKWNVKRQAPGYFRYQLSSGDITVLLSTHAADSGVPNCKIEIGSLSCWSGVFQVFNTITKMLKSEGCRITKEIVSRVDLCADIVGLSIRDTNTKDEDFWITKARNCTIRSKNRKYIGIEYGKGSLMLRIYDKVQELLDKKATAKQAEFATIWELDNYDSQPVTRTEFQLRRDVLREFSDEKRCIDTMHDLQQNLSSIWLYCVRSWARHTSKEVDRSNKNQSQSVISDFWSIISAVSWEGYSQLKRAVSPVRKNLKALTEQMRGLAITLASSTGLLHTDYVEIISVASKMLSRDLFEYMTNKPVEYLHKYQQRQAECLLAI